jgi:outer membrane protein assembly factor BamD
MVGCILALGCGGQLNPADFPNQTDLYRESLRRLEAGDGRSAIAGFERLTLELPARDTLLPRSHFHLGRAHTSEKEWLLAAQAFTRMASLFPQDTLADDALLQAAHSYARIWDDPELDPTYGQSAIAVYNSLIEIYPTSPLRAEAERGVAKMQAMLAEKDFLTGEHYRRRHSPHSAILYYKQVIERFPGTPRARDSYAKMAEVYKSIGYEEDVKETCVAARERYPGDPTIRSVCGAAPVTEPPPP